MFRTHPKLDQTIPTRSDYLARLVLEPFVCNNNLRMALEPRLDPACLPIPEHHVAVTIARREPPRL